MKRLITIVVLSTGLAAGPVMADHQGSNILNRENVGGAIGAAIGGLAGNKIVDGKGQSAATAAGAVGGFLLGKNIAHNYRGSNHYSSGSNQYPSGSNHYSSGSKHRSSQHSGYQRHAPDRQSYDHRSTRLNQINETFVARTTSNVRAGPGTGYSIIDRVHRSEPVHVVGKVQHRDWYMVEAHGRRGFVYAPLLVQPRHGYRDYSHRDDHGSGGYRHDTSTRTWYR